jgi:hypothetical protein
MAFALTTLLSLMQMLKKFPDDKSSMDVASYPNDYKMLQTC